MPRPRPCTAPRSELSGAWARCMRGWPSRRKCCGASTAFREGARAKCRWGNSEHRTQVPTGRLRPAATPRASCLHCTQGSASPRGGKTKHACMRLRRFSDHTRQLASYHLACTCVSVQSMSSSDPCREAGKTWTRALGQTYRMVFVAIGSLGSSRL